MVFSTNLTRSIKNSFNLYNKDKQLCRVNGWFVSIDKKCNAAKEIYDLHNTLNWMNSQNCKLTTDFKTFWFSPINYHN